MLRVVGGCEGVFKIKGSLSLLSIMRNVLRAVAAHVVVLRLVCRKFLSVEAFWRKIKVLRMI